MHPLAPAGGPDAQGLIDRVAPLMATVIDDIVVALAHTVDEPVVAHELPEFSTTFSSEHFGGGLGCSPT